MFNTYNETSLIIMLVLYLTVISVVGAGLGLTVDNVGDPNTTEGDFSISTVTNLFSSFWNLLTFNVNGIPTLLNLIFIQPAIYGLIFLVLKAIIVNVIPLT